MASLQYSRIKKNAYSEAGGDAVSAVVNRQHSDFLQGGIGGSAAKNFYDNDGNLQTSLDVYAMYLRTFNTKQPNVTTSFIGGGPVFNVAGTKPSSKGVETGVNLTRSLNNNLSLVATYTLNLKKGFQQHSGFLRLNYAF